MAKKVVKKEQIIEGLALIGGFYELNEDLTASIDFVVSEFQDNPRNVTKEELQEITRAVGQHLDMKFTDVLEEVLDKVKVVNEEGKVEEVKEEVKKVENNKKPVVKKAEKKAPVVKKAEASVKKAEPKEEEVKETKTKAVTKTKKLEVDFLETFPKEFKAKAIGETDKLVLRDDLKTIEDLAEAYENEADLVIATYWTKKLLKQYADSYDPMNINPNRPKAFEHDLDLVELTFANHLVATGNSLYSYIPQIFVPKDFEQDEEGMRYVNGCEFQIYEVVQE